MIRVQKSSFAAAADSAVSELGEPAADGSDEDEEEEEDLRSDAEAQLTDEELAEQARLFDQSILTTEMLEKDSEGHKAGYVAIIGRPNAGKSTLLNSLLGQKLSAVTQKAQTTRHRILGILSEDDWQLILLDTPGVIKDPKTQLDRKMMHNVNAAVQEADAILVIVDATEPLPEVLQMPGMAPEWSGPPAAVVLNKTDLLHPEELSQTTDWLLKNTGAASILHTSAIANEGVESVRDWAVDNLPLGPTLYPKDSVSEQSERFFVAEIVREQIFLQYHQEVPYCTAVRVLDFKERQHAKSYIQIEVMCETDSQRPILLGKKGSALKQLSTASRIAIEEFLQTEIFLDISVKVQPKWRRNEAILEQYGY